MFRKPRSNIAEGANEGVIPSLGRPPTPPQSPPGFSHECNGLAAKELSPVMTSVPSLSSNPSRTGTSLKTTSTPLGQETDKGTAGRHNKSKGKGNASILSFFKKVEVDRVNGSVDSLFLDDDAGRKASPLPSREVESGLNPATELDILTLEQEDDHGRYNEVDAPSKRRKLSLPTEHNIPADIQHVDGMETSTAKNARESLSPSNAVDDSPSSEVGKGTGEPRTKSSQTEGSTRPKGPFLDDSDSETENPFRKPDSFTRVNCARTPPTPVVAEEDVPEPKLKVESVDEQSEQDHIAITDAFPPHLKRENTSYAEEDGFAGFEGLGDFDDEYAEGEEFMQRQAEMQEAGFEADFEDNDFAFGEEQNDQVGLGDEPPKDTGGSGSIVPTCPICNASFAGISDHEASVHVNHCLDGNPTPLPSSKPSSKEVSGVKQEPQPAAARFRRAVRPAKPGQESPFVLGSKNGTSSAFSMLMSGHAEDAAWANAAAAENAARGKPAFQRTCPFYKILPGLHICVDAFRYGAVEGCNAYFLSHFHSDHYIGLTSTWCHGPIYCSRVTANLVRQQLRVDPKWVVDLEFEKKMEVPGTEGVSVTMIPANHCPGSSLYLFEKVIGKGKNPKVQRILHCGDFRACPAHVEHPLLRPDVIDAVTGKTAQQKIDVCYLDTTYLNPKYAFPSQEDVIQACADMCVSLNKAKPDKSDSYEQMKTDRAGGTMAKFVRKDSKDADDPASISGPPTNPTPKPKDKDPSRGRLLVVVGTYSIGKERICLGIARALNSKIYAPPHKQRICAALEDPELSAILTSDPRAAQVHMTPLFEIRAETLGDYLAEFGDAFTRCVGFRPSGWNYRPPGSRFVESPAVGTVLHSENWRSVYTARELVPQRGSTARAACYGVPYSEHSSFRELTIFCCALRIEKIVPTVNVGSAKSREKMKVWCERWAVEKKKNGLFKVSRDGRSEWYPGKGTMELRTTL